MVASYTWPINDRALRTASKMLDQRKKRMCCTYFSLPTSRPLRASRRFTTHSHCSCTLAAGLRFLSF